MQSTQQPSPYSSNSIRLSLGEWSLTAIICLGILYLLPVVWPAAGQRLSGPDYRIPGELSSDYWMFAQWSERSRGRYRAVVLGDSVVWGQYARSDDTLAHHLNEVAGRRVFANLGVDGLHPAAMAGMVSYYGKAVEGRPVLLHLNPLWMSSEEQDLQSPEEARFNHPKLVPQVLRRPASYAPMPPDVIGAVLERQASFFSWKEHLTLAYREGMGLQDWTLEYPYTVPFSGRGPDAYSGDEPGSEPMTWRQRGIERQDLPWVEIARSYQWRSFTRTIEILRARQNRVFVLLGPFNTHALTGGSQARYQALAARMEQWLEQEGIPYCAPAALPTDLYADASHPLGSGYREIAKELYGSPAFQRWVESWESRSAGRRP